MFFMHPYNIFISFFWLGSLWFLFIDALELSKWKANLRILEDQTKHGKVIEFVLLIENNKKIRIQFICSRIDVNIPFILYTFDLDIVQVTYDDERIIPVSQFFFLHFKICCMNHATWFNQINLFISKTI